MAQIIKHRRGSIDSLAVATAKKGELVMATGSVGNMQGPWIFVGETEGSAGAFRGLSKIYQGTSAPDLTVGTWGSTLNGTPYYASSDQTLYILSNSGNVTMDLTGNIEGNVINSVTINNLSGNTNLNGDLLMTGNTYQTGSITLTGDVTLRGNINIGDNLTGDTININGEISSSLVPAENNVFDLGSTTNAWRDLYVSGTAYIEHISLAGISVTNIDLPGNLVVSGTTVLSGSVFVEDLTQTRIVHVGADGQLIDNENFTYDLANGFLLQTSGSVNINTSGSFNLKTTDEDDIYFSSSWNFEVDAASDINLTSADDVRIQADDVFVLRNTGIGEDIAFITQYGSGNEKLMSFDAEGNLTIPGGFTGSFADINTQAQLASAAVEDLTDNRIVLAGVGGELEDDANLTFNGTELNIGVGKFTVQQSSGNVHTAGTLNVSGATTLESSLSVTGTTTLYGSTYITGLTENRILVAGVGGLIEDDGNLTFDGTTFKIGNGFFEVDSNDGDIRTSGSFTIEDGLTINGDLNVAENLNVTGRTIMYGDLYVSGNVEFLATASYVHISSSIVELDDNIIRLNAYSPFERYAGFEVIDSGSTGVSASMVWDSLNDYWLFVSSSGESSKFIGTTAGTYGSEISLTNNTFPIATGPNTIGDSLLTMIASGTTLAFNTNKFTVNSTNGDTLVSGNFTLSFSGATDNGTKTSAILFRNSANVVGFVSTTETEDVLDGVLGYKNSNGALVFSTVIDGGLY